MNTEPNLQIQIAGLKLKNPVMVASGTFGFALEFSEFFDLNQLGAIVVKSLTLEPREGNPPPRIAETAAGMLNSIGLQNPGVHHFISKYLPHLRQLQTPIIANIAAEELKQYLELARTLNQADGIAAIEVNISCPNIKAGGMWFGKDKELTHQVINTVKNNTKLPVIAKLTPNVTDITQIAESAQAAGADAISLVNTFLGMAIDINIGRSKLGTLTGGLSGPAIKPIALRMVYEVAQSAKIPVIGMGGIMDSTDAIEFLIAGAQAIAVGTANLVNPRAPIEIIQGLKQYLIQHQINDIKQLIGSLIT